MCWHFGCWNNVRQVFCIWASCFCLIFVWPDVKSYKVIVLMKTHPLYISTKPLTAVPCFICYMFALFVPDESCFSSLWQATCVLKSWGICQHTAYTVFSSCVMDCMLISEDHKIHDSDFPFGLLCLSLVVWHFLISSKFLKYVYKYRPEYSIKKKLKYSVYSVC